jgi:uncharacterized protein YndB with AHSA1/START domain
MSRIAEASATISAPPERVLERFLNADAMCEWWGASRGLVVPERGGAWAMAWDGSPDGHRVATGVIADVHPASRLVLESYVYFHPGRPVFGPMRVEIRAEGLEMGTLLRVRHEGFGEGPDWDWYHDTAVKGWPETLAAAKRSIESRGA